MDVFNLDQFLIDQYKTFSRSFTKIKSPEISSKANALYDDKQLCHVQVTRANKPVYVTYERKEEFFVRKEESSQPLSRAEEHEWNKGRF